MNAPETRIALPAIGEAFAGGYYAGLIEYGGSRFAIILAPAAEGRHDDAHWNSSRATVAGALSYCDGRANTKAMAEAGSELAKWALAQRIADREDWYIPAVDELEVVYRNLKPTTAKNGCWARAGINLHAVPPTLPYTPEEPRQTGVAAFQEGGEQAIADQYYWTSTQHAGDSGWAWCQYFGDGGQGYNHKSGELPALLVRRELIR